MINYADIRELHLELTTKCNAQCPMCPRNYRGYDFNSGYPSTELSLSDIKKILPVEFLKQINTIHLNGNLGDFSVAHDALDIVRYFIDSPVPRITITTNGSTRSPSWWAKLSDPKVDISFALDGLSDSHSLYRQQTNWNTIIANATAYIKAGGVAVWKFIPFLHNRHQIDACREMAKKLGFRELTINDEGRDQGPVFSRDGKFTHWIGTPDTSDLPPINEMVENHLTWFNHADFKSKDSIVIDCETKRLKKIYIAADGSVYPCCYLGFFPGQMKHPGNSQIEPLIFKNNALEYGIETCLQWFAQIESAWQKESISEGLPYVCVNSCGKKIT